MCVFFKFLKLSFSVFLCFRRVLTLRKECLIQVLDLEAGIEIEIAKVGNALEAGTTIETGTTIWIMQTREKLQLMFLDPRNWC